MELAAAAAAAVINRLPEELVACSVSAAVVTPQLCRVAAGSDVGAAGGAEAGDGGCGPEKELAGRLCGGRPVLLDGCAMVRRTCTAKCVTLPARALRIARGDDPSCWTWTPSLPGSRFSEVAELVDVCWLEITGKLQLSQLSRRTTYAAYLVFAMAEDAYGLECHIGIPPPRATVTVVSSSGGSTTSSSSTTTTTTTENTVCLQHMQGEEEAAMHRRRQDYGLRLARRKDCCGGRRRVITREADFDIRCPRRRGDGWAEVELGEFAAGEEEEDNGGGVVEVSLRELDRRRWKRGLIVQCMEIRPKHASYLIT